MPGYYTEVGLIAREARNEGINIPHGWRWMGLFEKLSEIGGESINGSYFSNHYNKEFIRKFEIRFGSKPDSQAASSYDAARILFETIKKSKSLVRKAIRDAIASTENFNGVTGNITINEDRNPRKSVVVLLFFG